jgi:hypothetical protein
MKRPLKQILTIFAVATALGLVAEACGYETTFRAYLGKRFWRPFYRYAADLKQGLPKERKTNVPYAGMATGGGSAGLRNARQFYQSVVLSPPYIYTDPEIARLRTALSDARPSGVAETQELDLLRCKIELRAAKLKDAPGLQRAEACFESYLKQPKLPSWASEARGWLARTYFLRGLRAKAAKIYLDELKIESSNVSREILLNSLASLYPKENRPELLKKDLPEYFDTAAHALFAADLITNPNSWEMEKPDSVKTVNALITELIVRLENRQSLFQGDAESDALALALMRAATRQGAPASTLRYADRIPESSVVRDTPEYNWLVGVARFQENDYQGAEKLLIKVLQSKTSDHRHRQFAWNALIGVYAKLNQPVDQLAATFEAALLATEEDWEHRAEMESAGINGWVNLDVAYLLDVQLADAELQKYLERFPDKGKRLATVYPRERTPAELVQYALAVRHARREEFERAAQIYQQLHAAARARRMTRAAKLAEAAQNTSVSNEQQLQARYDYAAFLADNSDGIFFNDSIWKHIQGWTFQVEPGQVDAYGTPVTSGLSRQEAMTPEEADRFNQLERRLRDEQEEYWRAYLILNDVIERAGATPLGRKAAEKAIFCLRKIAVHRFGRAQEIRAADIRISNWITQK